VSEIVYVLLKEANTDVLYVDLSVDLRDAVGDRLMLSASPKHDGKGMMRLRRDGVCRFASQASLKLIPTRRRKNSM
jgi:hypothetical protein